jgi:ubiquinone/menaquinone biosynthesis C-methylase UbiE
VTIHPDAAQGFSAGADAYDRGRPSYPAAAVDHVVTALGIGSGRRVLDLGAGTGKFTELLVPTGAALVAVEPVAEMRAKLAAARPDMEVLDGTGEALPLGDASVDAVTVAQAFHWFDPAAALAEIARVLRPEGGLALLWNARDESVPWVAEFTRVIDWHHFQQGHYRAQDWAAVVAGSSNRFTPVEHATFAYEQRLDRAGFVDRVASISYIAAMAPADRDAVIAKALAVVEDFPEEFVLPYTTEVWTCRLRSK